MAGIYWFLGWFPFWGTAVLLYFLVINVLFVIRDWREKLPYNISVASQQGDPILMGIIFIGAVIIGRHPDLVPWLNDTNFQKFWVSVSISIGFIDHFIVIKSSKSLGTLADAYHNLFIIPLLVFFLGATIPVIYLYGTVIEQVFSSIFLLVWVLTFEFDYKHGRLQQTKWFADHGIELPLKKVAEK
jgi:hypothetical protein